MSCFGFFAGGRVDFLTSGFTVGRLIGIIICVSFRPAGFQGRRLDSNQRPALDGCAELPGCSTPSGGAAGWSSEYPHIHAVLRRPWDPTATLRTPQGGTGRDPYRT